MSSKDRIETGPAPALTVTCQGDLVIKGWDEAAVTADGEYDVEEKGGMWTIASQGDLRLHIPETTALHIAEVAGDAVIKVSGVDVAVDAIFGDLVLRGVAAAKIGVVHGDVTLRNASGPVSLAQVTGDLAMAEVQDVTVTMIHGDIAGKRIAGRLDLDEVTGDVELRMVSGGVRVGVGHGDANLADIGGEIALPTIHKDITLRGGLGPGNHVLNATRDITLRWPMGKPVNLIATAPRVTNRMTLDAFDQKGDAWVGHIGDGKTNLELTAGRKIELRDAESPDDEWAGFEGAAGEFVFGMDLENMGERVTSQINEKLAQFTRNMETQFGPDFGREIGERMARKAEQAAQRAEKAAENAAQRAEAAADRAAQRADKAAERGGRKSGNWKGFAPSAPSPSAPPRPASPDEQLKILQMVEKGIISPEEATALLEALES